MGTLNCNTAADDIRNLGKIEYHNAQPILDVTAPDITPRVAPYMVIASGEKLKAITARGRAHTKFCAVSIIGSLDPLPMKVYAPQPMAPQIIIPTETTSMCNSALGKKRTHRPPNETKAPT